MNSSNMLFAVGAGAAFCFCVLFLVLAFIMVVRFLNGHVAVVNSEDIDRLQGRKRLTRVQKGLLAERKRELGSEIYGPVSGISRIYNLVPELEGLGSDWEPRYEVARIPKRSGGFRELQIPDPQTKKIQHALYHKLFANYETHPSVCGFVKGRSILDNARPHVGHEVVIKLDIKEFFPNTYRIRVNRYFSETGWDPAGADLLTKLVCYGMGLPQGAPTSPVISNIVNKAMDVRLLALAEKFNANYTRYADDITFSLRTYDRNVVHRLLQHTGVILRDYKYTLNGMKQRIIRYHRRQQVTGLVVNDKVSLPRSRRRWLRAVQHRLKTGQDTTVSFSEYQGWISLVKMVSPDSPLLVAHQKITQNRSASGASPLPDSRAESNSLGNDSINGNSNASVPSENLPQSPATSIENAVNDLEHEPENHAVTAADKNPIGEKQNGDNELFHEDRLIDQLQAMKNAKAYSVEAKRLEELLVGSTHKFVVQLDSFKRTFSFKLPASYQRGRTVEGVMTDGTAVELYFEDRLVEVIESAEFPLKGEVAVEVLQWNSTFKRLEALVIGGLFH
ncbi:MAG: reverse transcriptase family protein [Pirellulales bacterium]|nr:reverse transcriptase family protein [Pirellulales bacterium]